MFVFLVLLLTALKSENKLTLICCEIVFVHFFHSVIASIFLKILKTINVINIKSNTRIIILEHLKDHQICTLNLCALFCTPATLFSSKAFIFSIINCHQLLTLIYLQNLLMCFINELISWCEWLQVSHLRRSLRKMCKASRFCSVDLIQL